MATIPHLKIPFSLLPDLTAQVVAQDSIDDIQQCVAVLCATTQGTRIEVPTYGIPDPVFSTGQPAAIEKAVAKWEPRAQVTATAVPNPLDPNELDITVQVKAVGS